MKRKILALCVVVAMLTVAIVSSTMAYFTDTDQAVNVMTMGNVDITQWEYTRKDPTAKPDDGNLIDFKNGFEVVPAVYDTIAWEDEGADVKVFANSMGNVYDKFIRVENTGKSAAYVRTFLAFEDTNDIADKLHISYTDDAKFAPVKDTATGDVLHITVDGVEYEVYCYTYPDPVEPNGVTEFSLKQFFFDKTTTNEDVKGIDEYKILALSQAIQAAGFTPDVNQLSADITAAATNALNEGFGDPVAPSSEDVSITNVAAWFGGVYADYQATLVDTWDGTVDITWYNDTDAEFTLATAEQLAGLAELVDGGNTFEGKTVKLGGSVDLYLEDANGEAVCFEPIGSYRNETSFKGTFDGQGNSIINMSQNTWALDNGYYYGDLGLGLFGLVEDATIKNLVMDNASISGESAMCGTVAATAYGDCTFENITVRNSKCNDYQYYAGGVVGWASGNHKYTNINVEASTIIGGQWGDFGNANGGVIGGIGSSAVIEMKDCTIACRIDAVNDVVSAYQWYNYRNSGMLIGRVPQTIVNGEAQTVKTPENVTCENVKVIYGDWANYHYCEFAGTGYPFVRVEAGVSVDAYTNVRYGHPTDANGNEVVDDSHVHNEGEAHMELIIFDQLFGGPANHRYCYYGISEYDGVTVVYNNK